MGWKILPWSWRKFRPVLLRLRRNKRRLKPLSKNGSERRKSSKQQSRLLKGMPATPPPRLSRPVLSPLNSKKHWMQRRRTLVPSLLKTNPSPSNCPEVVRAASKLKNSNANSEPRTRNWAAALEEAEGALAQEEAKFL